MRYAIILWLVLMFLSACNVGTNPNPEETTVPIATIEEATASPNEEFVQYWLGSETAINENSEEIGCATYITSFDSDVPKTSPENNILASLSWLFNNASTDYSNHWQGQELTVTGVLIENNQAQVTIEGGLMLIGTCGDAEMEAQILLSIFGNTSVESAYITVDGQNLRQYFDMSGLAPVDFVYTRENIPYTNP